MKKPKNNLKNMQKNTKQKHITKKRGVIAGLVATVLAIAHVTHFPVLLLAFFGLVSASFVDSLLFKVIAIAITVLSVIAFVYFYKNKKCRDACIQDNNKHHEKT